MNYFWLTNLLTPVDDGDGVFLNTLKDYRLGPPQATKEKSQDQLVLDGVMGVYTTEDAIMRKELQNLTGFSVKSLSQIKLGDITTPVTARKEME